MRSNLHNRARHLGAGLALAVLGAACGPGGTISSSAPTPSPTATAAPTVAPWIAYQAATEPSGIRLVHADGSGDHALSELPAGAAHPDWSPDGRSIVFVVDEDDSRDIWLADADGSNARPLVDCEAPCVDADGPAFSPDGTEIAYRVFDQVDGAYPGSRVEIIDLASREVRVVATTEAPEFIGNGTGIRWSPDGASLVFDISTIEDPGTDDERVTRSDIAVADLDGSSTTPRRLTDLATLPSYADWSPIDDLVVFMAHPDRSFDGPLALFSVAVRGSDVRQITDVDAARDAWGPTYSPDGSRIFVTVRDPAWTLGFVDPRDGSVEQIPGPIPGGHPREQPVL